jgi:hypothetical protein
MCEYRAYVSGIGIGTYGISAQGRGGRTERCWDEKSVAAERFVEPVGIVGEVVSVKRMAG